MKDVDITKFGVAIIESLKICEPQTGTKLCQDVLSTRKAADDSLFYDYYSVYTIKEFEETIHSIISKLQPDEMLALHVEAHGGVEGVRLASDEIMSWGHFLNLCRELNIKEKGLLVVTTAMCYSLPFMAAINPSLRAPFKAIVITRRDVSPDEILRGYSVYFSMYKNILDIGPAKDAMRNEVNDGDSTSSPFEMITADWLFEQITNVDNNPEGFPHIVNERYCIMKSKDPSYTRERVETEIRQEFHRLAVEGKDYYSFADLWKNREFLGQKKETGC